MSSQIDLQLKLTLEATKIGEGESLCGSVQVLGKTCGGVRAEWLNAGPWGWSCIQLTDPFPCFRAEGAGKFFALKPKRKNFEEKRGIYT